MASPLHQNTAASSSPRKDMCTHPHAQEGPSSFVMKGNQTVKRKRNTANAPIRFMNCLMGNRPAMTRSHAPAKANAAAEKVWRKITAPVAKIIPANFQRGSMRFQDEAEVGSVSKDNVIDGCLAVNQRVHNRVPPPLLPRDTGRDQYGASSLAPVRLRASTSHFRLQFTFRIQPILHVGPMRITAVAPFFIGPQRDFLRRHRIGRRG